MRVALHILVAMMLVTSAVVLASSQSSKEDEIMAIRTVLQDQITAWNRGDLEGFMAGYWNSPDFVYVSNTTVVRGWDNLLGRYQKLFRAGSDVQMGILSLPQEEISLLDDKVALVWGTYEVSTTDNKNRGGMYTLVMRKTPKGWVTVHDRTSSEPHPVPAIGGR